MAVTASKLRENIYKILDESLRSGKSIEIERKGKILRIVPESQPSKFSRLRKRKVSNSSLESLEKTSWKKVWKWDY